MEMATPMLTSEHIKMMMVVELISNAQRLPKNERWSYLVEYTSHALLPEIGINREEDGLHPMLILYYACVIGLFDGGDDASWMLCNLPDTLQCYGIILGLERLRRLSLVSVSYGEYPDGPDAVKDIRILAKDPSDLETLSRFQCFSRFAERELKELSGSS